MIQRLRYLHDRQLSFMSSPGRLYQARSFTVKVTISAQEKDLCQPIRRCSEMLLRDLPENQKTSKPDCCKRCCLLRGKVRAFDLGLDLAVSLPNSLTNLTGSNRPAHGETLVDVP